MGWLGSDCCNERAGALQNGISIGEYYLKRLCCSSDNSPTSTLSALHYTIDMPSSTPARPVPDHFCLPSHTRHATGLNHQQIRGASSSGRALA